MTDTDTDTDTDTRRRVFILTDGDWALCETHLDGVKVLQCRGERYPETYATVKARMRRADRQPVPVPDADFQPLVIDVTLPGLVDEGAAVG